MKASTLKILRALEQAGDAGLTTGMLVNLGSSRFGARVKELRDDGFEITMEHLRPGSARYTLIGRVERPRPFPVSSQDRAEREEPVRVEHYRSPHFCIGCFLEKPHDECLPTQLVIRDHEPAAEADLARAA